MSKRPYSKPATTYAEQVNLLRSRGMEVDDQAGAEFYANLKPMPTRTAIASVYGLDQRVLGSWLHHLTLVRNVCAHHSRLWDREFSVAPMLPQRPHALPTQFQAGSRKLYNSLLMLLHCMDRMAPRHHCRRRLIDLIDQHAIPVATMGFPADWKSKALWQEVTR